MSDDEHFDEVVYETRAPIEAPSRECFCWCWEGGKAEGGMDTDGRCLRESRSESGWGSDKPA